MDQQYRERNVQCCDDRIQSIEARIENVKATGENVKDLKKELKGYAATRTKLLGDSSSDVEEVVIGDEDVGDMAAVLDLDKD